MWRSVSQLFSALQWSLWTRLLPHSFVQTSQPLLIQATGSVPHRHSASLLQSPLKRRTYQACVTASWTVRTGLMNHWHNVWRFIFIIISFTIMPWVLQVYKEEFKILLVFTILLACISIFCNYIIQRKILIIKCYGKRKLQEMHMIAAHQARAKVNWGKPFIILKFILEWFWDWNPSRWWILNMNEKMLKK